MLRLGEKFESEEYKEEGEESSQLFIPNHEEIFSMVLRISVLEIGQKVEFLFDTVC